MEPDDHDASSEDNLLEIEEAELSSEEDVPVNPNAPAQGGSPAYHDGDVENRDDGALEGSSEEPDGLERDGSLRSAEHNTSTGHEGRGSPARESPGEDGEEYALPRGANDRDESSDGSEVDNDLVHDDHEVMNGTDGDRGLESSDGMDDEKSDHEDAVEMAGSHDDSDDDDRSVRGDPDRDSGREEHDSVLSRPEDENHSRAGSGRVAHSPSSSLDDGSEEQQSASDAGVSDGMNEADEDPDEIVLQRPSRKSAPLKIPDELREDSAYFRRSRRTRNAVSRFSEDFGADTSDAQDDNDSDFDARLEADDDAGDADDNSPGDDSDDFNPRTRKRARTATRRPQRKASQQQPCPARVPSGESSGSDDDWGRGAAAGRRRGSRKTKRRARTTRKSSEDDEGSKGTRVNARTGCAINYAEAGDSDSDIFDEGDAEVNRAEKLKANEDGTADAEPRIEAVCDYRVPEDATPYGSSDVAKHKQVPFADFDPNVVEFHINWLDKSFRRNTWHKLEELKAFKGFKKVTNYVTSVAYRRDELQKPGVTAEEHEEAAVLFQENRTALEEYTVVERVVGERVVEKDQTTEYLVKWQNRPYCDCTWEPAAMLDSVEDMNAIDAYSARVQGTSLSGSSGKGRKFNPFGKEPREKFRKMKEQPKYLHGDGRTLREYQLAGLNWLAFSWSNNRNVILADEMGLGKTLQTISFLGWIMYERNVQGPFLVIVPLSTIAAWVREFARWLPELNTICYTGNPTSRRILREYEFYPPGRGQARGSVGFHAVLTTPELVLNDLDHFMEIRWAMIAIDEAHRLKNQNGELHRSLSGLTSANRLLVTGTPLQNSVVELWALLHFLHPDRFDDPVAFEDQFSFAALRDEVRVANLHDTLRPYIIRRQKVDVEKSLPQKTYSLLRVGMATEQQNLYRLLLTKNYAKLNVGKGNRPVTTLRNLVMELKKCCNHPFLFDNVEDTTTRTTVETLIRASGKMILLDKLLLRLREKGHRVLVFSQMVRMLDILSDYCRMRGFLFQRLDGSMPNDLRVRAVDHFNAPGSTDFMFLLSTRAGGLGINLATADTVIIFDSDWNPQNDLQAESRAHRIGQTKDVKVFRLVSRETVEEDILERAKRKRVLEHLVIHGVEGDDQDNEGKMKFNKKELSAILRFGAEKLFKENAASGSDEKTGSPNENGAHATGDDIKAEEKRVMEIDDIDELLARAPVEQEEQLGAAEANMGDSLLNAFKWADFDPVADDENEEGEIAPLASEILAKDAAREIGALDSKRKRDLAKAQARQEQEDAEMVEDDAEYWARVIPEDMKGANTLEEDTVLGTRRRKRTKAYGATESPDLSQRRGNRRRREKGASKEPVVGELSRKEERHLLRSWKKFGSPSRAEDILRDASLLGRIEVSKVQDVLHESVERARQELRRANDPSRARQAANADDDEAGDADYGEKPKSKTKGPPPVSVVILGEQVNARELIRRVDELQVLSKRISQFPKGDTHFRLRKPIKAPAYGVPWKPKHDAMLLVGINRHGLGNWVPVAGDEELMLGDRITVPGGAEIKGAPDGAKLTRRATALLKEVMTEDKLTTSRSSMQAKGGRAARATAKAKAKTKVRGSKRERSEPGDSGSALKRPRLKSSSKTAATPPAKPKPVKAKAKAKSNPDESLSLRRTHLRVLKDLRKLSVHGENIDQKEKIRRLKDCLMSLGDEIMRLSRRRQSMKMELWTYVHNTCRTAHPGERLAFLYDKVMAERKRHSASAQG